jgi:hypothetical protein
MAIPGVGISSTSMGTGCTAEALPGSWMIRVILGCGDAVAGTWGVGDEGVNVGTKVKAGVGTAGDGQQDVSRKSKTQIGTVSLYGIEGMITQSGRKDKIGSRPLRLLFFVSGAWRNKRFRV